jgi:hypothetical protein
MTLRCIRVTRAFHSAGPLVTLPLSADTGQAMSAPRLMLAFSMAALGAVVYRRRKELSVALVELFAYVGDKLSHEQDAAASEAYLDTARRRISVRRHGRLIDCAPLDQTGK